VPSRRVLPSCVLLLTAASVPLGLGARDAHAYDPQYTHRWIAWQAIDHLVRLLPGDTDLLRDYAAVLVDGVEHEDDIFLDGDSDPTTLRLMRHFYNPVTGEGLSMEAFGDFPSSYVWGGQPNEQNLWDYQDALRYYQEGDIEEAFFALGHVVHLIQDATVPAHTHLDDHGPPYGDSYEEWCTAQMRSDLEGNLPLPPLEAPIPQFSSLEQAWQLTASASYWRNMVPGALSSIEVEEASGVIAQMFPDIEVNLTGSWEVPGVGVLGKAFWEDQPGYFYFKRLERAGAVDRAQFDPYSPERFVYDSNDGALMVENVAQDMIPLAVLHSAGVIKMFLDDVAALPPPGMDEEEPAPPEASGCSAAGGGAAGPAAALLALAALLARRRNRC